MPGKKGLVRKAARLLSLVVSCMLVSLFLPKITSFLTEHTPICDYISEQCEDVMSSQLSDTFLGSVKTDQQGSIDRDRVKLLMEQYGIGYLSENVDEMSDEELEETIARYFSDYMDQLRDDPDRAPKTSLTKVEQTKLIQGLPLPDFMKELMLNFNNSEGYRRLEVDDFSGYVAGFFASIILNVVAFIVTLLIVNLLVNGVVALLDLVSLLPVAGTVNRLGGLLVGGLQGLLVIWLLLMILSLFSGTETGMSLLRAVEDSAILRPVYENNLFMKPVVEAISNLL